jgi:predicted ABC-type transport system involved in lysophospholipase L1 biosynthesis ATPase subunit
VAEALSLEHVRKAYSRGDERTSVLSDVSFAVGSGEVVAIVGRRLAGKTTLLRIAAGMEQPDGGSVSLGGQNLGKLGERSRSRLLGHEIVWIARDGPGLNIEVSKFVGWPLALHGRNRRHAARIAAEALERVGAGECVRRRWRELSDWQRVLVGFAQAFAGSPQVVIVDNLLDALGSKDSKVAADLMRSLIEESEPRCGVLLSVSDIESAIDLFADRVFSLTRDGGLKSLAGQPADDPDGGGGGAEVIPLPKHAEDGDADDGESKHEEDGESRGVGS